MPTNNNLSTQAKSLLETSLKQDANNWEDRKKLAHLLYEEGLTNEAAELIWDTPEIPSIDLELGFAIKVLAKGAPRRAIRLINAIQELNQTRPVQNLGIANALMHNGMALEAARFYGAAIAQSNDLTNPDLEHFLLWTDDQAKIWGDFNDQKPELGPLPWMKRDAKEAAHLKKTALVHTTPIKVSTLEKVDAEKIVHEMYVQSAKKGAQPTPPPSVTIPIDRVNPKDVLVDSNLGASQPMTQATIQPVAVTAAKPIMPITRPASSRPRPRPSSAMPTPSGTTLKRSVGLHQIRPVKPIQVSDKG